MEHNEHRKSISTRTVVIITVVALVAGFFGGQFWIKRNYSIMNAEGFDLLQASYGMIEDKFLYDTTEDELINGAITGMVQSLDDQYSQFHADQAGEEYVQSYEGSFYGIGAEINGVNGRYFIASLVKDMPAEQSGLQPDDEIVEVDKQAIEGLNFNELLSKVRGEKGTKVSIGVKRAGSEQIITFEIERAEIPVYTVNHKRLDNDLGVIAISRFAQETANEFAAALQELQNEGELNGLIIDLRSNPGGLLDKTTDIASMLIPKGEKILDVVYKDESRINRYVSRGTKVFDKPIVVLINEFSASASEVLSAALKETVGAQIVGVTSYGKGVVQQYVTFREGSVLVLTEAEWKTPSGNGIHEVGVEPTHKVELPSYAKLGLISTDQKLKLGSYGEDVKTLQQYLQVLGYLPTGVNSGEGLFDEATEQALSKYERDKGLSSDGVYDMEVGAAFVQDIRTLLADNDTQMEAAIEVMNQQIKQQ